jgi:hypothetical protein
VTEDAPTLRLLDQGREPRQALRYHIPTTRSDLLVIDEGVEVSEMSIGGRPEQPVVSPPIRTTMRVEAAPTSGSVIAFSAKVSSVEMLPAAGATPSDSMRSQLQQVVGISGSGKITDRGLPLEMQVRIPPGLPDSLTNVVTNTRDSMKRIGLQLPAEAVGQGARWEFEETREWKGIAVRFTHRYQVRELPNRRALLEVSVEAATRRQYVKIPNLPEGASALLESTRGTASGQVQLDTETLVHRSEMSAEISAVLKVALQGGQVIDMQMSSRRKTSCH